jgi:hypothetical protein
MLPSADARKIRDMGRILNALCKVLTGFLTIKIRKASIAPT